MFVIFVLQTLFGGRVDFLGDTMNITKKILFVVVFGLQTLLGTHWSSLFAEPSAEQVRQRAEEYCTKLSADGKFNGTAMISRRGQIIFCEGYGFADFETHCQATPVSHFRLASLAKQFTAMAIMILQERHLLNISDPISKFLPSYPNGSNIKILHLLTHTSGLFCCMMDDPDGFRNISKTQTTIRDVINLHQGFPMHFYPGQKYKYCNYGYSLLARIIEIVSGKLYGDFLKENIFEPLEMHDTGVDFEGSETAVGYKTITGRSERAEHFDVSCVLGAADLYSTVLDLSKWDRALYTEKLVKRDSLRQIFTPYSDDNNGFGWFIYNDVYNRLCTAHCGGISGSRTMIKRFINDDVCVVVLSNLETTDPNGMSKDLAKFAFDN